MVAWLRELQIDDETRSGNEEKGMKGELDLVLNIKGLVQQNEILEKGSSWFWGNADHCSESQKEYQYFHEKAHHWSCCRRSQRCILSRMLVLQRKIVTHVFHLFEKVLTNIYQRGHSAPLFLKCVFLPTHLETVVFNLKSWSICNDEPTTKNVYWKR